MTKSNVLKPGSQSPFAEGSGPLAGLFDPAILCVSFLQYSNHVILATVDERNRRPFLFFFPCSESASLKRESGGACSLGGEQPGSYRGRGKRQVTPGFGLGLA